MSVVGECRWPQLQPINEASCTGGGGWDNKIKGKIRTQSLLPPGKCKQKTVTEQSGTYCLFYLYGEKIAPLEVMIDQEG